MSSARATVFLSTCALAVGLGAGCTSILGDFTTGASGDGGTDASTSDVASSDGTSGGDAPPTTDGPSSMDVTTDAPTDGTMTEGGGPTDGGGGLEGGKEAGTDAGDGGHAGEGGLPESGPTCGASNCASGCCDATGQCVDLSSQSAGSCGTGGVACAACAQGTECVSGACACDTTSCSTGCCTSGGACIEIGSQNATSCGTGGAACTSCPSGQGCGSAGQCECDSTSCSNGCCSGGQSGTCESTSSESFSSCGTGGAACAACSSSTASQCNDGTCGCGTGGACLGGTTCCSGGDCTDLQTDGTNCGSCGHNCGGSTCMGGLCQPITVAQTLHNEGSGYGGIAVNPNQLFVTDNISGGAGYVEQCALPACSGGLTTMYTVTGNPGLALTMFDPGSGLLYFGANNEGELYAINPQGSLIFTDGECSPYAFATNGSNLYFATCQGLSYTSKASGGTITNLTTTLGYTRGVAVDPSTGTVWAAAPNNSYVASCTGTNCTTWPWTGGAPIAVTVVAGYVYVMDEVHGLYQCASTVDCSLGNAIRLSSTGEISVVSDADSVYYCGDSLQIEELHAGSMTPVDLAVTPAYPIAMTATDMQYIWWLNSSGAVQKVAK